MKILLKILGLFLAFFLLWRLLHNTDASLVQAIKTASLPLLFLSILLYGVVLALGAWRWGVLLSAQNIRLSFFQLFSLTLTGAFYSTIIPGSVSGDLVKLGYIFQIAGDRRMNATLSIAMDRLLGLAGLLLLATLLIFPLYLSNGQLVHDSPILQLAILAILGATLALAVLLALLLSRRRIFKISCIARMADALARKLPKKLLSPLDNLCEGMDLYSQFPTAIVKALIVSIFIHVGLAAVVTLVGKSLHEVGMTPLHYTITTQFSNATGILPLTPGGVGIRDTVAALLFQQFGATPAAVLPLIPVTYTLVSLFWTAVGAIFAMAR